MNNVLSKNRENLLFYFACFGVLAIASVYAVIAPAHMDELSSLALYSHDWRGIFIRHEPNNHALTTLWGAFSGQNLIVARMVSVLSLLSIIIILARTYGRCTRLAACPS